MQKCLYEQEKLQIKSSFKNIFYNLGLKLTIIFIIINLLIIFFIIWCKKKKKSEKILKNHHHSFLKWCHQRVLSVVCV